MSTTHKLSYTSFEYSDIEVQLAWWGEKEGKTVWTVTPGRYAFCVGSSSADTSLSGICTITGKDVTKPIRNEYFSVATVR